MTEANLKSSRKYEKPVVIALWVAGIFTFVGLAFLGFSLYALFGVQGGQANLSDYVLLPVTILMFIASLVGFFLIRRGRFMAGVWLLVIFDLVIPPVFATLLIESVYQVAIAYVGVLTIILVFVVFPPAIRWHALPVAAVAVLAIIGIELWSPAFREPSSANLPKFTLVVEIVLALALYLFLVINLWRSGRMRNRMVAVMVIVSVPLLTVYAFLSVRAQQKDLEQLLLERAKASAGSGAAFVQESLENAIATGELTTAQVFDQNYIKFFDLDTTKYPEIENPEIYAKYHTAYDSWTDEHWQAFFDSYMTSPDIAFGGATDINGYIPTHVTVFSSGDGNPATDRTKRIYTDAVGVAAAQNTEPFLQQIYVQSGTGATLWDVSVPIYVNDVHWGVFRVGVQLATNQERVQTATTRTVISSIILLGIMVVFFWMYGRYISNPIERLTAAAQEAAGGNLDVQINIPNRDEITILGNAFNRMTGQLRDLIQSLEARVASRTKDLATVAEVGTATASILESEQLLQSVVDLTKERFGLYHSHIYLLDEAGKNLVLTAGAGEPGRQMRAQGLSIPLDREQSLVARAARERKGVTVNDVTQAPDFLPNPLLPNTRAELAVPMLVGDTLIGVFDIQSDVVGRFTDADINIQTALAAQLATSIQNVRSFERARTQAELEAQANAISQKIQRATSVEDALQVAIRELGLVVGASRVQARIGVKQQDDTVNE